MTLKSKCGFGEDHGHADDGVAVRSGAGNSGAITFSPANLGCRY
eukprot:CAMPEP_0174382536 /NCGR_PEP_ID=MMETSP0811_2-20130205/124656_1 /TAXON_ID=73025 ORGANISM="Eutreptiella gymnastica-like, Strain CCMP1594" /NCGR_SAMPLE_ID=MMETSP0811_2 /ASSEMBLY_ACC=CAM_ASM_000667 /LENGTH=43 /DNA_ID= /DNA_START= /DNA_END= /DNA_ORIENTATION=